MFNIFERWTKAFPSSGEEVSVDNLWKFCWFYTKGYRLAIVLLAILSGLLAYIEVSLFAFMSNIIDWLSELEPAKLWAEEGKTLIVMGAVLLIGIPVCSALYSMILHQSVMSNFPMSVRWRMHTQLLEQSMSFYQNEFAGRIATKVMQTALAIREIVIKCTDILVFFLTYFIALAWLFFELHVQFLLVILSWFVIYVVIQRLFIPRLKTVSTEQADARSTMTGRITDAYANITTIKLFSHSKRESEYARESMVLFLQTALRQFRLVTVLDMSLVLLNYGLIFATALVGIRLWVLGEIGAGAVAAATAVALRLNGMSKWLIWEISALFENIGTTIDGMAMLAKPKAVRDKCDAKELVVSKGEVVFEKVSFAYQSHVATDAKSDAPNHGQTPAPQVEKAQPAVLKQLNLTIKAGEKIGLVGRSGAGKSTLVNLLLRFYDVQTGRILIDNQDIRSVSQQSLRQAIAMVTQDTALLHRSVRENILYGRPDSSEQALIEAIEQAEASGFIAQLSDMEGNTGLDAQVGERGVKLSGGQRQRIAIARVLLKNAPILILDEATSALDSEVEAAIQASLTQLMAGKTVIAIAHRLSTIAQMDRLIVMDKGEIVEEGTHAQLLAKNGVYAQLWARQTGGYLGDSP